MSPLNIFDIYGWLFSGKNGEVKEEREDWCYSISKKPGTPQSRELSVIHNST